MALVVVFAGCATVDRRGDDWFGRDKAYHCVLGGMISAGASAAAREGGAGDGGAMAVGVGVTMALGAGKESYDEHVKKTYWSWRDMTWNLVGSILGGLVVLGVD